MVCPKCKTELQEDEKFCHNCGKEIRKRSFGFNFLKKDTDSLIHNDANENVELWRPTKSTVDVEYGYSIKKPICIGNNSDCYKFLSHLENFDGEKLFWERVGERGMHKNTICIFDLYAYGTLYKTIYINMHKRSELLLPCGLVFSEETTENNGDMVIAAKSIYMTLEQYKQFMQLAKMDKELKEEKENFFWSGREHEVDIVKNKYPEFDLNTEKNSDMFNELVHLGFGIMNAFEYVHKEEYLIQKPQLLKNSVEEENYFQIIKDAKNLPDYPKELSDEEFVEQANENGMTLEQFRKFYPLMMKNRILMYNDAKEYADRVVDEALKTKALYPAFSFGEELKDERFVKIFDRFGVRPAYEVLHLSELFSQK